jgi:uncharacterized repeat protein (TIGR01451 family)
MSVFNHNITALPGWRRTNASLLAMGVFLSQTMPALPAITNDATSSGTYNGSGVTSPTSSASVNVTGAAPKLEITSKTVTAGPTIAQGDTAFTDVGDTITYQYVVQNTGNVTLTSVFPLDPGPTFNSVAGTGSWAAGFSPASATLLPGASQTYTRTWTFSNLDAYRASTVPTTGASLVSNTATARGTAPNASTVNSSAPNASKTATAKVDGFGKLQLTKTASLTTDTNANGLADAGDVITYTYKALNIGNAPLTNVQVADTHEPGAPHQVILGPTQIRNESLSVNGPLGAAASSDATANNGIWSTLAAGAEATFTYAHTVLQVEVDAG